MMVTKTQAQEANTEAEESAVKHGKDGKGQLEEPTEEAEERKITPLDEAVAQVQRAYTSYKEAERYVAKLYKKNEEQVTSQHRNAA
jgi:cob(I)alamin adenosyltransferase